jgi:hypothetical protein
VGSFVGRDAFWMCPHCALLAVSGPDYRPKCHLCNYAVEMVQIAPLAYNKIARAMAIMRQGGHS